MLSFLSSHFVTWPKRQDKNLNILGTKRAFDVNFKGLSAAKNCLRSKSAPLRKGDLMNFVKLTGKHLCKSLFYNKVAGLRQ